MKSTNTFYLVCLPEEKIAPDVFIFDIGIECTEQIIDFIQLIFGLFPIMGTLIESYEQQYSSLTAEITFNIGRISNTHGGKYSSNVRICSEFG